MKTYKKILYTAIVLSLVSLFTVANVSAHGLSNDFYSGEKAGSTQVNKDTGGNQCTLGLSSAGVSHVTKQASGKYVKKLQKQGKSNDYIIGFRNGYERTWLLNADLTCGK